MPSLRGIANNTQIDMQPTTAVIKAQTSQPVQRESVECFGCNSDTTLVQCRKSLFLEGLSNRADTMAVNGGVESVGWDSYRYLGGKSGSKL